MRAAGSKGAIGATVGSRGGGCGFRSVRLQSAPARGSERSRSAGWQSAGPLTKLVVGKLEVGRLRACGSRCSRRARRRRGNLAHEHDDEARGPSARATQFISMSLIHRQPEASVIAVRARCRQHLDPLGSPRRCSGPGTTHTSARCGREREHPAPASRMARVCSNRPSTSSARRRGPRVPGSSRVGEGSLRHRPVGGPAGQRDAVHAEVVPRRSSSPRHRGRRRGPGRHCSRDATLDEARTATL